MSDVDLSPKLLQALNDDDQTAIRECVEDKSVTEWINNRVDRKQLPNARRAFADTVADVTCLGFASGCNDSHTVRLLVQAGADVTATDSTGRTPLHWACVSIIEANQKVEYLLSRDSSLIKARTNANHMPLHRAVFTGNDTLISVLIQRGAKVNEQGQYGRSALHYACSKGHVACVHELMRHGADVDARDKDEATPLRLAAYFNQPESIKVLLDKYDASINATGKFGNTALHCAACSGNLELVRLLTSYSQCDITATNNQGEKAADLAKEKGHMDIVDYLTSQPSFATVTSSLAACNITDDKKVYGK